MGKPTLAVIGAKGLPFVYSGYETFVAELCARLKDKYEIHVYCHRALFRRRPPRLDGVRLHYIPAIETKHLTHVTHGLLSTLHAALRGYDLYLYVNSAHGPFGWLLRALGKRTLINTDGLEWKRPQLAGAAARYYRWASGQAARAFTRVVADSGVMADVYREEFGVACDVIEYGAHPREPDEDDGPERLPVGARPGDYHLVVGRLIPDNNAELIIEGFKRSGSARRLIIVGDLLFHDPYLDRVRRHASDRVLFTGFVRDRRALRALYRHAYAYVHGHEFGGTNPTLLEGLATGSCVLALDTPFSREVLADGAYGRLFRRDPDDLARVLKELEADPAQRDAFRARAPGRVRDRYTWERVAGLYDGLLADLLRGRP